MNMSNENEQKKNATPASQYQLINHAIYSDNGKELYLLYDNVSSFVIPEGVEVVKSYAFSGRHDLTSVSFPASLMRIEKHAFENTSIETLDLSANTELKVIEDNAFSNCIFLKTIILNEGLEKVAPNAFHRTNIRRIHFSSTFKGISDILRDCFDEKKLREAEIAIQNGSHDTIIDGCLFTVDGVDTSLRYYWGASERIPDYITCIGAKAFYGRKSDSLIIPSGVSRIDSDAFKGYYALRNLTVEQGGLTDPIKLFIPSIYYIFTGGNTITFGSSYSERDNYIFDSATDKGPDSGLYVDTNAYDRLFSIYADDSRAPYETLCIVALSRLNSAVSIPNRIRDAYITFLDENAVRVFEQSLEQNSLYKTMQLLDMNLMKYVSAEPFLVLADNYRDSFAAACILEYKNKARKDIPEYSLDLD